MSESLKADVIINQLKAKAASILGSVLGTSKLHSFNVGSKGNMPYYWQDPRNLEFNEKSYNWINSNLKADTTPTQLDQNFTNIYIDVLSKVNYSLSKADQAKLNHAKEDATDQQGAVLMAWKSAFGSFPDGDGQPIDNIASQIASNWAKPSTTLQDIQQSININALLNNVPASGKTVVPVFVNWLNAIGESISLENNVTMNNAYLARALAAAQSPTDSNGGLKLNNNDVVPSYGISTSLASILNGLKDESNTATMSMTVKRSTESEFTVKVEGEASFSIPVLDLFTINVGGNASYFKSDIATTDNETTVEMSFPGVTLINFGPSDFTKSPSKNWYWMKPITDAISNESDDVSGFKFSPEPQVDFSDSGNFGFLIGTVISNYPSVKITVKSASYDRIQTTFEQSASVGVSFLGIPLGIGGSESTYSNKVTTNSSDSTVTITLNPPPELVAGASTDSVGWILGVQTSYPAQ